LTGERILAPSPSFAQASRIARGHHENWDGSGYPDGLAGDRVPIEARIVHLVDVFDALTSARVYKPAWSPRRAAELLESNSGTLFDPDVSRAFKSLILEGEIARLQDPV
jgi:HD-GYP domain-containing protein (c-di-GMP phosphodiesterase class II)